MKQLIYTTFLPKNKEYEELIFEWLISLRFLAKYEGEVVVFDYGMLESLVKQIKKFDVSVVKVQGRSSEHISNARNIDTIPTLKKYQNYVMAHYDADVWFQKSLDPMFEYASNLDGLYFATEYRRSCRYRGPGGVDHERNEKTQELLNGFVFGGWQAGKSSPYIDKLEKMKTLFETTWDITEWGSDQSMLNSIYDFDKDDASGLRHACTYYFCDIINDMVCYENTPVTAVHLTGFNKMGFDGQQEIEKYRFKNLHKKFWQCHHR